MLIYVLEEKRRSQTVQWLQSSNNFGVRSECQGVCSERKSSEELKQIEKELVLVIGSRYSRALAGKGEKQMFRNREKLTKGHVLP